MAHVHPNTANRKRRKPWKGRRHCSPSTRCRSGVNHRWSPSNTQGGGRRGDNQATWLDSEIARLSSPHVTRDGSESEDHCQNGTRGALRRKPQCNNTLQTRIDVFTSTNRQEEIFWHTKSNRPFCWFPLTEYGHGLIRVGRLVKSIRSNRQKTF